MRKGKMAITVICIAVWAVQVCEAASDREEVERLFDDFAAAYRSYNLELMKEVWSHEDDVRCVSTTPPGRSVMLPKGWNWDGRGWDGVVEHFYEVLFGEMRVVGTFENVEIQIQGEKAWATFDARIWGIPYEGGVVFFRKEGDEWKVYMVDLDNLEASRSRDESGKYAEIAFEAATDSDMPPTDCSS